MSSGLDAINDSYQQPELATQPTALDWGPTGGWVGTAHHSLPLAKTLHEALTISGLILPTPLTLEWGSGHLRLSQTSQMIYVDAGSLGTWALHK